MCSTACYVQLMANHHCYDSDKWTCFIAHPISFHLPLFAPPFFSILLISLSLYLLLPLALLLPPLHLSLHPTHSLSSPPPSSPLTPMQAKPEDTLDLCQILNNDLAATVAKHPKRFIALGTLPLQAPELAVQELKRCIKVDTALFDYH